MKSLHSYFFVAMSAFGASVFVRPSLADSQGVDRVADAIAAQVAELERSWQPGLGSQEREYYVRAGQIAAELFRHDPAAASAAAVELLGNLLAKRSHSRELPEADFEVGETDLLAMDKVARYLLAEGNAPVGAQEPKMRQLAKLLGLVRGEIVPDYVPKRVSRNVSPPSGGEGVRFSGMAPEAIADPVAREQYKTAIRENQLNNLTNKRQRVLHEMEQEFSRPIVEQMSRVASTGKVADHVVRQSIVDAQLTDTEKNEVIRALQPERTSATHDY